MPLKKFINYSSLLMLLSFYTIFSEENNFIVISLGIRCLAAVQIERYGLKSSAYPFDWNNTEFDSLLAVLKNDFADFLSKEKLKVKPFKILTTYGTYQELPEKIIDGNYDIVLMHDFSSPANILKEYDEVKAKYERRIKRFYDAIYSGKHVYFIRCLITRNQALQLTELLNNKFPFLDYTLIAIDYNNEIKTDWKIPKVTGLPLGNPKDLC